jgi:hypothetical protein
MSWTHQTAALSSSAATGPGDRIGRYVLRHLLAQGGMGAVWVADDPLLDTQVALKLLLPETTGQRGVERLCREARAAAQLDHAAIVRVMDFGVTGEGQGYLALELLEGESMATVLARGRLTPITVARLMLPILDGLAAAHARGVVHRDIKPENLFIARVARRIQPKIVDFGVARWPTAGARLTGVGLAVGTPTYMAPEQARGDTDVDGRADQWAIAISMFELIAGFPPFVAASTPQLLSAILERTPPSLKDVRGVGEELAAIIARALSKDRRARFPDARAMGEALAAWLVARGIDEDVCGTTLRAAWRVAPGASAPSPAPARNTPAAVLPVASRAALAHTEHVTAVRPRSSTLRRAASMSAVALSLCGVTSMSLGRVKPVAVDAVSGESPASERALPLELGAPHQPANARVSLASPPSASPARTPSRSPARASMTRRWF